MDKVTFGHRQKGRKPHGFQEKGHSWKRKQYLLRPRGRSVLGRSEHSKEANISCSSMSKVGNDRRQDGKGSQD